MKFKTFYSIAALSVVLLISACNQNGANSTEATLDTKVDSVSYALGYQNGKFLTQQGITDLNSNAFSAGLNTGLSDADAQISDMEAQQVIQSYIQEISMQQGSENLEEGESFLAENLENEDVVETESGLQYKVIEEGTGESPSATDVVRVDYEGKLVNGEIFDSSYQRGEPIEFPLSGVIPGWTEGVQLMKEGATYEFYIPGNLAYGENPPQGSPIGPNATLIFKVELLEINPEE
ncbi:MAG: FKBP-type peptidyl-prolyl cis-trans isomerase [Balneolaceae bacterium]